MATLHKLELEASGGIAALKSAHRDWSPFIVHFTSSIAMRELRDKLGRSPRAVEVRRALKVADEHSFEVVSNIAKSATLKPSSRNPKLSPYVSFSECTLPSLIAFSERYGRFGLVFDKKSLYKLGARPCLYIANKEHKLIERHMGDARPEDRRVARRLLGLLNVYTPPGEGRVQDFTHEREWRLFSPLDLNANPPSATLVPTPKHGEELRQIAKWESPTIPTTLLYQWGL